ncbi:hypothetical protein [Dickeya sp. NCPPB 3274]|uniref:hypothetical protein n=1 Tax=Dickeya sp. NCPPB 3274 TaxID=568766 RepID=UPI0005B524F5|nr:hypothetical protein [Dickeya sp. NCPPB 3274]
MVDLKFTFFCARQHMEGNSDEKEGNCGMKMMRLYFHPTGTPSVRGEMYIFRPAKPGRLSATFTA